jgi:hypothetical protein
MRKQFTRKQFTYKFGRIAMLVLYHSGPMTRASQARHGLSEKGMACPDEAQFAAWVKQAGQLPGWSGKA